MRTTGHSFESPAAQLRQRRIVRRPTRRSSRLGYWLGVIVLLAVTVWYNSALVRPAVENYTSEDTYSHIANIHDHLEYESWGADFSDFSDPFSEYLNNVAGISLAYLLLTELLGFDDVITTSLLVNCVALIVSAFIHRKICNTYAQRGSAYTFFLNLPLIYFCQLVGKDMLYITVLYGMLLLVLQKRWMLVALLAVVAAVIRMQTLIVFLFIGILSYQSLRVNNRLLLVYVLASIAGARAFTGNKVIGLDADIGSGVSWLVFQINSVTGLGNLLLNPVRIVQYVVEFFTAPFALIRIQAHFFTLFLLPYLFYLTFHADRLRQAMMAVRVRTTQFVIATVMVMLIIPIINLRYFVTLMPFIVIAMLVVPGSARHRRPSSRAVMVPAVPVRQESA